MAPEEPFEAERLYISELHADEGWVQCDRCNKWRPPIKPTKSSNKKRRTTLCGGGRRLVDSRRRGGGGRGGGCKGGAVAAQVGRQRRGRDR